MDYIMIFQIIKKKLNFYSTDPDFNYFDEDEEEKPAKQPKGCEEDPLADNRLDDGADGVYDGFDD